MMNFKRLASASILAGLVVALVTESALAGVQTYSASVGATPTDWADGSAQTVSIPLFNTQNGQLSLTGVSVTLANTASGSALITANSGNVTTTGAAGQVVVSVVDPDSLATGGDPSHNLGLTPSQLDPGSANLLLSNAMTAVLLPDATYTPSGSPYSFTGLNTSGSTTYNVGTDPVPAGSLDTFDTLSSWIGTGNQTFYLVSGAGFIGTFSGSGSLNIAANTLATANMTVTYDFVDAPEPASLALLGAGLAGLGMIRRRKRKAS